VPERAPHIGTLGEKSLHASLKRWYAKPGDQIEVPIDGYVIDLVRDDLLIEIQTRGFSGMRSKLINLLAAGHRVRIVHPIPVDKHIVRVGADGVVAGRRLSPRHGQVHDVFSELVSFPVLLAEPRLELEVVLISEEEQRHHVSGRAWRRKGWMVAERRLLEVRDSVMLSNPDDLVALLPAGLPSPFTTADLALGLGTPLRTSQQMAYCLREMGLVDVVGKRGNHIEYRMS
jgi:hypothetical protein